MSSKTTKLLTRTHDYRIEATLGDTRWIGKRVRLVLDQNHKTVPCLENGFIEGLDAYVLTGKQSGQVMALPPVKLRAASTDKCNCWAYNFPHAPGFGQCKGEKFEGEAPDTMNLQDLFTTGAQR